MTVDEFRESVMQLKPNSFMALNGAAPGIIGGPNSGLDALVDLQRATLEFTRIYKSESDANALKAARHNVSAKVMVAQTLNAISLKRADELMDSLHQLMEERK